MFHRITLLIGDEDVHGDPADWNWETLDIAPFVYILNSSPISLDETPFDRDMVKEWEVEEKTNAKWYNKTFQRRPKA